MGKRWTALFVPMVIAGFSGASAQTLVQRQCFSPDPDLSIRGCTAIIQSGQETGQNLAQAFYNRGNAYRLKGQPDHAIEDFDQAIRFNPNYAEAFYRRGFVKRDKGDSAGGDADIARAKQLNPSVGGAAAQEQSLKDQLVGTWLLASCYAVGRGAGQFLCTNPAGSLSYNPVGRYMLMIAPRGRPRAHGSDRADIKPEEYKAVAQGVVAQFGTWSVNVEDKTLTQHAEGSLFPNAEGQEMKFSVSLISSDELKLAPVSGGAWFLWRRAK